MRKFDFVTCGALCLIVCILIGLLIWCFSGCSADTKVASANDETFTKVGNCGDFMIVYDRETKVMYAVSNGSYNGGTVTLLVDADGKPKLYSK